LLPEAGGAGSWVEFEDLPEPELLSVPELLPEPEFAEELL
jgi:hypothetical protein